MIYDFKIVQQHIPEFDILWRCQEARQAMRINPNVKDTNNVTATLPLIRGCFSLLCDSF